MNQFNTKRIIRDLREFKDSSLIGLSVSTLNDDDIHNLIANVQVQDGIYSGLLIPILINLPLNYPLSPPSVFIQPGHPFTSRFHEHVIGNGNGKEGTPICTDMTKNFHSYFDKEKGSGWNPAYAIEGLMLQLQTFFADPDLPSYKLPTKEEIAIMMQKAREFKIKFKIKEDGKTEEKVHSYDDPYPPMILRWNPDIQEQLRTSQQNEQNLNQNELEEHKSDEKKAERDFLEVQNKLCCPILKRNIVHDPTLKLGYPMMITKDKFDRVHVTPVIELMSFESMKILKDVNNIGSGKSTSIFGEEFNDWVPVYINNNHFKEASKFLKDLASKFFPTRSRTFNECDYLRLIPPILVKTTVHFLKGDVTKSFAAIDAYCQYHYLLRKLIESFPEIQKEIDNQVESFIENRPNRHKRLSGDLGELLIKLSLSKYGLQDPKINYLFFEECMARKVSWSLKEDQELKSKGKKANNLLDRFFRTTPTTFEFYLLQYETAKLLINKQTYEYQEKNYGCVNEDVLREFWKKLGDIQKNVNGDWKYIVSTLGLEGILNDEKTVTKMVEQVFDHAEKVYEDDIYSAKFGKKY